MKQLSGAVAFVVAFVGARHFMAGSELDDRTLMEIASKVNETTPFMVDKETRLDNAMGANGTLTYHYTMVNYGASEVPSDFMARIEPTIKNTACTNPETKILFENGVSLHYSYKGKSGTFIGDFVLTPADCGL